MLIRKVYELSKTRIVGLDEYDFPVEVFRRRNGYYVEYFLKRKSVFVPEELIRIRPYEGEVRLLKVKADDGRYLVIIYSWKPFRAIVYKVLGKSYVRHARFERYRSFTRFKRVRNILEIKEVVV